MWPRSWNSRSFCSTTVWPRWMSGAVGSMPSFTRSGRPFRELPLELALRQRVDRVAGEEPGGLARRIRHGANARLPRSPGAPRARRTVARTPDSRPSQRGTRPGARTQSMQEPPTSIIQPSPTHGPALRPRERQRRRRRAPARAKPKLKKLRLALIVLGLSVLALISTVFGMMMAVAQRPALAREPGAVPRGARTRCSTRAAPTAGSSRRASRSRS